MLASNSDTFYKYYAQRQRGGALASVDGLPVFRASPRRRAQGGAGLGDILRSAFRWFLPVAMRGASTFANKFLQSHDAGATFREAAKSAIGPTLGVAGDAIKARLAAREKEQQDKEKQTGTGRKRKRRVYKGVNKKRKTTKKKRRAKKQVGLGKRRRAKKQAGLGKRRKTKNQLGGKRKRKAATKRRNRRRASSAISYNF